VFGCLARKDPMPQTLRFISAARRLRGARVLRSQAPASTHVVTPIAEARAQSLADFEREVQAVREAIFHLADTAHDFVSQEYTQLHVSLQIVSNELGQIERVLAETSLAAPSDAARAS
jgi:hypothetical protein